MRHEYYYYNKEELLKNPKIPLIVMEDNPAVFRSMAEEMVEEINKKEVPCSDILSNRVYQYSKKSGTIIV